jgi:hypothetical protein
MLDSQRFILYGINLIFDALSLFIIYVLFLKGASWQDLGLFFAIILPVIAVSGALYTAKPSQIKLTLFCTALIAFLMYWLLTSSLLFSMVLALIITWRSTENWQDPLKADIEVLLAISATVTVLLSLFLKDGYGVLYGAVWVQFILMIGIKMYIHYLKNPAAEKIWRDFSIPLSLIGLSAFMFIFLGPLKKLVNLLIDGILFLLYYLVAIPLWSFLKFAIAPLINLFKKEEESKSKLGELKKEIIEIEQKDNLLTIDYTMIFWITITLLAVIILIYIWKKKLLMNLKQDAMLTGNVSVLTSTDLNGSVYGKRNWLQSKDRTRKKFLHFEKVMDKRGYARLPGESAPLWFDRLKLSSNEAESVLQTYEKVRYGKETISNDEFTLYAKSIKKLEKLEHLQKKKST